MKKIALFSALFLVLIAGVFYVLINTQPVSNSKQQKDFIISQGENLISIATRLENNKIIKNKNIFIFYTILIGKKNKIQSGKYRLDSSLNTLAIIDKLGQGGVSDHW